ncbi:MAG: 5-formyltetrahydrofolate cyclo-ligase [Erysipelotrichaceae bacterium]
MSKLKQRKLIKKRLNKLSIEEKYIYSDIIVQKIYDLILTYNPKIVMSYIALENEVNLEKLHSMLKQRKIKLCFPVIQDDAINAYISDNFVKGSFNIMEPEEGLLIKKEDIDIIIIPCVGFDSNRNRLGHGKGYYDKYLLDYSGEKLSVAFEIQKLDRIDSTGNDIKMDYILTEKSMYL